MPQVLPIDDPDAAERATAALGEGALVVAPTDTVYAVLADAFDPEATGRLRAARHAAADQPLTVLVRGTVQLFALAAETPDPAQRLMRAWWPGALTLLLPRGAGPRLDLGASGGAIAVRQPDHGQLLALLRETGPLASSSACGVGEDPPRTVEDAIEALGDAVALYLDGGALPGRRSTVVDCTQDGAQVRRRGAVRADAIHETLEGEAAEGAAAEGEAAGDGAAPDGPAEGDEPAS